MILFYKILRVFKKIYSLVAFLGQPWNLNFNTGIMSCCRLFINGWGSVQYRLPFYLKNKHVFVLLPYHYPLSLHPSANTHIHTHTNKNDTQIHTETHTSYHGYHVKCTKIYQNPFKMFHLKSSSKSH